MNQLVEDITAKSTVRELLRRENKPKEYHAYHVKQKNIMICCGYCVGTFERTYHDSTVDVRYYKDNGLDGKVSLVANTWGKPVPAPAPAPAPAPRRISGSGSSSVSVSGSGTCGNGNRGNGSKWDWCGASSEHCSSRMLRGNSYNTTEEGLDRDRDRDLDLETEVHVFDLIDEPHENENDDWMGNNTNTAIDGNIDDDEPAITEKESYFYVDDALAFELELQMAAMTMDHGS